MRACNKSPLVLALLLLCIVIAGLPFFWTSRSNRLPLPQGVEVDHADFIAGLTSVYKLFLDLDYLEVNDVSFPPHAGSALKYNELAQTDLDIDIHELLQETPLFTPNFIAAHAPSNGPQIMHKSRAAHAPSNGPQIMHKSRAVTYLGDANMTALRQRAPDDNHLLPSSIIRLAISTSDAGVNIAYDSESKNIIQYQLGPSTVPGHPSTVSYFANWHDKLYDLEWLPWPGTLFQGIRPRPTQGYIQFFHNPNNAPQVEARFQSVYNVRKGMGEESESVDEMMQRYIAVVKAEYNMYWSMRVVYEQAGWPGSFVKERFRRGVDEWEEGWRNVTAEYGKDVGDMEEGKALREWYHRNAQNHAV